MTWKYLKKYLHFAVLASLFSGVLTLIGTPVMMLHYSVPLGLLSCSTVVLTVLVTSFLSGHMRRFFLKRQELLGALNGTVEEMVAGCRRGMTRSSHSRRSHRASSSFWRSAGHSCRIRGS